MQNDKLKTLYANHVGKVSDKWSLYLTEYDRLFESYRDRPVCFLEIGVQNGGSLEIWSKYFKNAVQLVGCDINLDCALLTYDDPVINVVVGDANSSDAFEKIMSHSKNFDIIIDDGSHLSSDIVKSFAMYFPHLNEGGVYVAEDLHCCYWNHFEGGLFAPHSAISFFKLLADIVNHEHWGISKSRTELMRDFSTKYGCEFEESDLLQVHSVEFINSICVVRKAHGSENILNTRSIAGTDELVVSGHRKLNNTHYNLPSDSVQSANPYSYPPEDIVTAMQAQLDDTIAQLDNVTRQFFLSSQEIVTLAETVSKREEKITEIELELDVLNGDIGKLNLIINELNMKIRGLTNSIRWKLSMPFGVLDRINSRLKWLKNE